MPKPSLLIVEDNVGLREQLKWALADTYEVCEADSLDSAVRTYSSHPGAVVCLDMGLENVPDRGLEIIDHIMTGDRTAKIIVITANTSESLGPEAIKRGAFDFLNKPVDVDRLRVLLERACRLRGLESAAEPAHAEASMESDGDSLMVGDSPAIQRVFEIIKRLAQTDVNVLITGESGTGKELCARAIHYHSARKAHNFVPINCGAIPENLIESELFGHVKGAFTGAGGDKPGLFEVAHEGTVLLDEIGEMPPNLQVRLLRFLEDQQVQRLGDTTSRRVNVRIIAATNRAAVASGVEREQGIRSDLYFRLSEFQIDLPPLRERGGDVTLIAQAIVEHYRRRFNQPKLTLSPRAEQVLLGYPWPGNVRELENKLSRAAITCMNQTIEPEDLQLGASSVSGITLKEARAMFEREFITNVLKRAEYNISEAAKMAGISRPTLYDMLKKHDIRLETETRIAKGS
jgi:two-component system NtrC family response regulator